ncbi:MAG TPA: glycosyl hydrolase, partial [Gemmatimonadales bacterium]|nr:glycosyl hydrolase [Gemmatimonadales bacterium]
MNRVRLVVPLGLLTLVAGAAAPAPAQTIPPTAYGALRWRLIGPHRGGRVLAVAGVPGDPATFYFGAVGGGVWRSQNAGVTWEPLFDSQPVASIGALAVAPSDASVIYVGTGEAAIRSDITYGAGVYKSTDGGLHWRAVGLVDTRHIGKILVDARNPDVVLVAALGHAYGPNPERGVFRSTDGGRTWTKVLYKDPDTGAIDLAADPVDPQVVYAALYQARRTPWEQYPPDEGPGSGLYKSTDRGATWAPLTGHGLPAGPLGRIGLAVGASGRGSARVYALIGAATGGGGLYRSDDGGATWQLAGNDPRLTSRNWYFCRVTVDPTNPDVVYVPNVALLKSTDGGKSFTVLKGQPGGDDYHELWVDPRGPQRMIVGSDQGAVISLDGGRTWSSWYNQPTGQFYHVVTDDAFPYRVYGAQQDAGTAGIASRSDYGEITFRDWTPVGAGESGYLAPDPLDADIVYGGDTYGGVHRFDRVTGQSQDISPWPISTFGLPMPRRKYRFTWTSPLVFDRVDRHALYLGAQMVLRSIDGGLHWEAISPDLTGAAVRPPTADSGPTTVANAAARGYGVVYTIAPSPRAAGLLWVGSDDGRIHRTADGGRHWRDVTPPGLLPWSAVNLLEASPFDTAAAYAAVDRHRLDDFAPYVYRTRDSGAHWTRADLGIAGGGAYVQAIRADPVRPGLLYAGTEIGVYVSFDDGDHWQSLQLNLPTASVRDLAVQGRDLVAATHGRSFWILDDLTPLRQLSDSVVRAPAHLFAPAPAIRLRRSVSNDTPLPPEEPHGTNPPAGAVIDYWLQSAASSVVTLEIRDRAGDLVRRFASDERAAPPAEPSPPPQFADEWLPRSEPLTTGAGLNRFIWDLRYAPPPVARVSYSIAAIAGQGTVAEPQGPLVVPGEYEVRLSVGGGG